MTPEVAPEVTPEHGGCSPDVLQPCEFGGRNNTPENSPENVRGNFGEAPENSQVIEPPYKRVGARGENYVLSGVRGTTSGVRPRTTPEDCPPDVRGANFGGSVWPYGTGGNSDPDFEAARATVLADLERLGVRGALDHWLATGQLNRAIPQVLTEGDIDELQRVCIGGVP